MGIVHAFDEFEVGSEQRRDGRRIVAFDWQAAALRRSVETERRDDRGTSDFERSSQVRHVRVALLGRSEEMENRAIVPDVDWSDRPISRHIGVNPGHLRRSGSEPRPGTGEGG